MAGEPQKDNFSNRDTLKLILNRNALFAVFGAVGFASFVSSLILWHNDHAALLEQIKELQNGPHPEPPASSAPPAPEPPAEQPATSPAETASAEIPQGQLDDLAKDLPKEITPNNVTPPKEILEDILRTHGIAYQDENGNWFHYKVDVDTDGNVTVGPRVPGRGEGGKPWLDEDGWHLHETPVSAPPAAPAEPVQPETPPAEPEKPVEPEATTKPVEPKTPEPKPDNPDQTIKVKYAKDSTYETAKLNLGGADTDGDGVPDKGGIARTVTSTEHPQLDSVSDKDAAELVTDAAKHGVTLTPEEAKLALQNGGFIKNGVLYEVWVNKDDASAFYITECNDDHRLVGMAPNFDTTPIETPVETPASDDAAPRGERAEVVADDGDVEEESPAPAPVASRPRGGTDYPPEDPYDRVRRDYDRAYRRGAEDSDDAYYESEEEVNNGYRRSQNDYDTSRLINTLIYSLFRR